MKKEKIMIVFIAIIAIAGGALSFKARIFSSFDICTTTLQVGINPCPNRCTSITQNSTAQLEVDVPDFCYTIIDHDANHDALTCQELFCPYTGARPSGN